MVQMIDEKLHIMKQQYVYSDYAFLHRNVAWAFLNLQVLIDVKCTRD